MTPRPRPLALVPSGRRSCSRSQGPWNESQVMQRRCPGHSRGRRCLLCGFGVCLWKLQRRHLFGLGMLLGHVQPQPDGDPHGWRLQRVPDGCGSGAFCYYGSTPTCTAKAPPVNPARRRRTRILRGRDVLCAEWHRHRDLRHAPRPRRELPSRGSLRFLARLLRLRDVEVCAQHSGGGRLQRPQRHLRRLRHLRYEPAGAWPRHRPASRVTTSTGLAV
jgi:hypothetical protein